MAPLVYMAEERGVLSRRLGLQNNVGFTVEHLALVAVFFGRWRSRSSGSMGRRFHPAHIHGRRQVGHPFAKDGVPA